LNTIVDSDPAFLVHPFMIQEYVAGHGQGVFALYNHGKPLAFFAHRRLREKPPGGGVSVLSESIATDPGLVSHARSLLDKVGWHGVAMVEFKVAADGTPYLMEINTRFWGSLQLAVDAGVDFPYLLYQLACGENPEPVDSYKTGIRLRWLLGDLDSLYLTLRDQHTTSRAKLMAVMRFLTPSLFKTRHEVNRWNDPGPGLCELRQYLRDIFG
jgi:predicted ATP-grasp superfamily ATP-dependent carboligase